MPRNVASTAKARLRSSTHAPVGREHLRQINRDPAFCAIAKTKLTRQPLFCRCA